MRLICISVGVLLVALHSSAADPGASRDLQTPIIRYQSVGWNTIVSINGVPILRRDKGGGQLPIKNLVVNGTNSLEIKASVLAGDDAEPLNISLIFVGQLSGRETTLIAYLMEPDQSNGQIRTNYTFECRVPWQWAWEKAPFMHLKRADETAIFGVIEKLNESFESRNLAAHNKLRSIFITESAKAQNTNPADIEAAFDGPYKPLFESPSFAVQVRSLEELNIVSYGRITMVSAKQPWPEDWTILLKAADQKLLIRNLLFSEIDGEWRVIN
jgi:hypothetical protein